MAAPSYVNASTGATDAGGAWSATGAAGTSGNVVIVQILQDGTTNGAVSFTGASNIENLAGTDNAWTQINGDNADGSFPVGSAAVARQFLFIGRLINASAPTISGDNSTSEDLYWRFYEFKDVNVGTLITDVIENTTAGTATNGAGTAATVSDTAVTTLGPDRLALQFVGISDDNAISAFTGETGGDWTEAVAEYAESSGTDASIGLQIAYPLLLNTFTAGTSQILGDGGAFDEQKAQSFTSPASVSTATSMSVWLAKGASPTDNAVVELQTDAGGVPSGTVLSSGSTSAAALTTTPTKKDFAISVSLAASTSYWIVIRRDGARDLTNTILVGDAGAYAGGAGATKQAGSWTGGEADHAFMVLANGSTTIDGGTFTQADGTDGWGVIGFALIPAASGPASPVDAIEEIWLQAVNRASVW